MPTFKRAEKDYNHPVASKENVSPPSAIVNEGPPKQSINNPYAVNKEPVNNPYAAKVQEPVNNPYSKVQEESVPVNNPYAQEGPKREKEGRVKKEKIKNKGPKEKINIYEQADDITQPLSQPNSVAVNEPLAEPLPTVNLAKTDELDLNEMLGINKKKQKNDDLDDLLGDIKVDKKKENKKKNTDFFNDLEL